MTTHSTHGRRLPFGSVLTRKSVWRLLLFLTLVSAASTTQAAGGFQAGAARVNVTPRVLPAIRNGGFLEAVWDRVEDPLHARSLVLSAGRETVAISVVDSCMLPTDVCDDIKSLVTERIGVPANRILIAATHTHSAPSTMDFCLGTRKDTNYTPWLISQVAEGIVLAHRNLRPAKAGWTSIDASEYTNCRRWIRRSDKIANDPFGDRTVRAMMHPGYVNPEFTGPAGPIDPQLAMLSIVDAEQNSPICLLANFSMHYFGSSAAFSADYFGEVAAHLESHLGDRKQSGQAPFVAIMSQGTSGDLHWMDYSRPKRPGYGRQEYSTGLAKKIFAAWQGIEYSADVPLAMAESRLQLRRRLPSTERLQWAAEINQQRGQRRPQNQPEVYAEQAAWIQENPETELILQALRIGELAVTAMPNEVYAITGLKLKALSPLPLTMNLELANGAEGYIPPPEQHHLGGYTTWPARTAGLEEEAEPKIVEALAALLEQATGKPRSARILPRGPYANVIMHGDPICYWQFEETGGRTVLDSANDHGGEFEDGIARYLPGVRRRGGDISAPIERDSPFIKGAANHAVHCAGGRVRADLPQLGKRYSVSMWFWNAMPVNARAVTGYLFSRGEEDDGRARGEHLGIGGTHHDVPEGRLFFFTGNEVGQVVAGKTPVAFRDWHHVVLVRDNRALRVYLDGNLEIEAAAEWTIDAPEMVPLFVGGRNDRLFGFEGKVDEVAIFNRPLSASEVAAQFGAAERVAPSR
jgi:hypothetical protein